MLFGSKRKLEMPDEGAALPGRAGRPFALDGTHFVLETQIEPPYPAETEHVVLGLGCFWGAERIFWTLPGVYTTAVGYAGGITPNPTYEEVCSGRTGQNEVVLVVFRPAEVSFDEVLRAFWEGHDPTQGMRQGNDVGTQYRSGIYYSSEPQRDAALASREMYQRSLSEAGRSEITTEIEPKAAFFYAEDYHQQYLAKNPNGYCGLGGTGVSCPVGFR